MEFSALLSGLFMLFFYAAWQHFFSNFQIQTVPFVLQ